MALWKKMLIAAFIDAGFLMTIGADADWHVKIPYLLGGGFLLMSWAVILGIHWFPKVARAELPLTQNRARRKL